MHWGRKLAELNDDWGRKLAGLSDVGQSFVPWYKKVIYHDDHMGHFTFVVVVVVVVVSPSPFTS